MKMIIPRDKSGLLAAFARETARMSYPGRMSGGKRPVVRGGTKQKIEKYFTSQFPMEQIWDDAAAVASIYDQWHEERTGEIARVVSRCKGDPSNNSKAIAAKFLNTFMHQLMKFQKCRPLFKFLHLPLDRRVFNALRSQKLSFSGKRDILPIVRKAPYTISYSEYLQVQNALWSVVKAINRQSNQTIDLTSRIELNSWMWV